MELRSLGGSDIRVAPLMFGGNVFGWTADEKTSFTLLDAFTDAGLNAIDTADVYSTWVPGNKGGESETIIGKWLKQKGNRDKVVIATKVGSDMGLGKKCLKASYIRTAVEDSLRRLQTDYIDLYQSHYDDPETPVEETLDMYATLVREGKVRIIGASNFSPERTLASLEYSAAKNIPAYRTLQPHYNLYDREGFETTLQPLAVEHKLSVIPYYSLASGFLTGKYRSEADLGKSARGGGMTKYLNDRGQRILKALDEVADQYSVTPATIALAWLKEQPSVTAPIASATSVQQLEALTKAASLQLSPEALALLSAASDYR
jgi:aryl-alcohol dehydrogenase-like predicted oxidoreductase